MTKYCLEQQPVTHSFIFQTTNHELCFLFLRLTGFHLPPPVTSTKSVFSLRLTSDFAVSAHGFKVYYEGKIFLTNHSGFFLSSLYIMKLNVSQKNLYKYTCITLSKLDLFFL